MPRAFRGSHVDDPIVGFHTGKGVKVRVVRRAGDYRQRGAERPLLGAATDMGGGEAAAGDTG